jgi:hypothetical protein
MYSDSNRFRLWVVTFLLILLSTAHSNGQLPTADSAGCPFVTQKAPVLKFAKRAAPHPFGIDYPFQEQTARGAALFSRFPAFTLSDRRIHMSGPWYNSAAANGQFTHGITSIEDMPNFRQGPTDIRQISYEHKWQLMGDPLFWGYASRLADELAASNPQDARIPALRTFANDHKFTLNEAAFRELGGYVWRGERGAMDSREQGVMYPCIDIEQTGGWENQRNCFGWLYQGMMEEAAKGGEKLIPITYGQWQYSVGAVYQSMRQGGTGDPEYLLPQNDMLSAPDPTLTACNDNDGVISMDGYVQAIWGQEPFYKRNPDGALLLADGRPIFNDLTSTTLYGQQISLEPGEAEHCLQDIYRQAVRMYLMHFNMDGAYPAHSDMRKSFLKNTRIGAWTRITNEGLQGIQQNDRPLPGWLMEMLTGMYLFTADDLIIWSSDMNTPPGPPGADHANAWKYDAQGVVEYILKAAHRYSALDAIHHGAYQWCWFSLPMVNKNETDGDRYYQKPIAFGKIRAYQGREWLELFLAWPSQDGQKSEFKIWAEKDGRRSQVYKAYLANGRSYFYDAWALPAQFKSLKGENISLQFKDPLGVTRTLRGDWRLNK